MTHSNTHSWSIPRGLLNGGLAAILAPLLLVSGAGAQAARQSATPPRPTPPPAKPLVKRNPNVQTPFDRVIGPHMPEYARVAASAPKNPARSGGLAAHAEDSGVGGTSINFPGFIAAPYVTLTGGAQTANTAYTGGYQSYVSVAGDFNGDGYPDVASAQSNGTINVILNPGPQSDLTKGIQIAPNTSSFLPGGQMYLFWLEAADLNGDGKLDLIGEDYHNSALVVWMGNGDGTFQNSVSYPITTSSGAYLSFLGSGGGFVVGDFNGDGAPDVATVETGFSFQNGVFGTVVTELTFLNDGKGNLAAGPESDAYFGDSYQSADAGQLTLVSDGSKTTGIAFLIRNAGFNSTSVNGTSILVMGSNGDGSFAPAVEPAAAAAVPESIYLSVPRTRLIATSLTNPATQGSQPATTDFIFMTGDGWVYDEPYTAQSGSVALTAPATAVVGITGQTPGQTRYNPFLRSRAQDSGSSTAQTTPPFPFAEGISAADANGDGLPDIFVYTSGATYVYLNGGKGSFSTAPAQLAGGHAAMEQPQPQDYNGSGFTSFPVLDSQQLELGYYQGNGTGLFYSAPSVAGTGAGSTLAISDNITVQATADLNGDGFQDVVAQDWTNAGTNNGYPDIVIGINNGQKPLANETNNFTFTTILGGAQFQSLNGAFIEPVAVPNAAGGVDVLLAAKGGLYSIAVNNGAASAPVQLLAGAMQCAPNFADTGDVNGDGIADIVLAYGGDSSCNANGLPSGIFTLLGKSDGTFAASFTAYGSSLYQARLVDFNGDGSPDLALTDLSNATGNYTVTVLPNLANGSGGFDQTNAVQPVVGYVVSDIIPGDYNADGKQDLTLATEGLVDPVANQIVPGSWGVLLLPGKGDFTFGGPTTVDQGYFPQWGSYADFNGDGAPDLALAEYGDTLSLTDQTGERVQLPSLVQILPNLGGGNFGPAIGEFDGYYEDTVAYDNVPSYSFSGYTFTGNFGSGQDLLVAGSFNSAEFLNQGTDSLTLTPSVTSPAQGDSVTLTAALKQMIGVNPSAPTGAVSFYNNGALLGAVGIGSDGTASISTSQLAVGTDAFTAVYAGDGHYNAANASATLTVAAAPTPDFTLAATPATLTLASGATGIVTLTATSNTTFQGPITFTCSGAPSESTCTVNPGSLTLNGSQTGTVTVVVSTTGKNGTTQAALWRTSAGGLALAGLVFWILPRRRKLPGMMLALVALLGFASMAMTGCGGSSNSDPGTPAGSATLTITATSGSISHTQTLTLQVSAPQKQ